MPELKDVFYEILVSHNHEIVMASDWLALLAEELAEAARQPRELDEVHAERTMSMSCPSCHRLIEVVLLASLRQ